MIFGGPTFGEGRFADPGESRGVLWVEKCKATDDYLVLPKAQSNWVPESISEDDWACAPKDKSRIERC